MTIELNFAQEAQEFLSRVLYRHSFHDRQFIFRTADLIAERGSGIAFWLIIPCYVGETLSLHYLHRVREALKKHPSMGAVFFINGYRENEATTNWREKSAVLARQLNQHFENYNSVLVLTKCYSEKATIGRIRGLLCAAVVVACLKVNTSCPYLICNDADTINVSDTYFDVLILEAKQEIKYVCGPVRYCLSEVDGGEFSDSHAPELFLFESVNQAIVTLCREGELNYEKRIWPDGANMMMSAAAYCAVGGFDYNRTAGEDDSIGRALHRYAPNVMKNPNFQENVIYLADPVLQSRFEPTAWIVTDPRRVLESIVRGHLGIEAWSVVPFSENIGAEIDLEDCLRRYREHPQLVQEKDLALLSKPAGNPHRDRAVRRIITVVEESGKKDFRIRNRGQMTRFINRVGLCEGSLYANSDKDVLLANISLENSPLLNEMRRMV